jgi:hypothetical protein
MTSLVSNQILARTGYFNTGPFLPPSCYNHLKTGPEIEWLNVLFSNGKANLDCIKYKRKIFIT